MRGSLSRVFFNMRLLCVAVDTCSIVRIRAIPIGARILFLFVLYPTHDQIIVMLRSHGFSPYGVRSALQLPSTHQAALRQNLPEHLSEHWTYILRPLGTRVGQSLDSPIVRQAYRILASDSHELLRYLNDITNWFVSDSALFQALRWGMEILMHRMPEINRQNRLRLDRIQHVFSQLLSRIASGHTLTSSDCEESDGDDC